MNNVFTAKLLQNLRNKKGEKGFTLIELLVVVIIIGVLAAVALPNLLGQVGKARESEAKSALGALNRAQQGYHLEAREFYPGTKADDSNSAAGDDDWTKTETALGVVTGKDFYTYTNTSAVTVVGGNPINETQSSMIAVAIDPDNDGARDMAAAMSYAGGDYISTLCIAANKGTSKADGTNRAGTDGVADKLALANPATNACDDGAGNKAGNIID